MEYNKSNFNIPPKNQNWRNYILFFHKIAGSTLNGRQSNRSINHALASSEMLRMSGGPARGWYPKQRHPRPASTENLDRIHPQGSIRAWDSGTGGSRKPLTLPPNLSPNFFNKSPREALRRVTSLLIRKGTCLSKKKHYFIYQTSLCINYFVLTGNNNSKDNKKEKDVFSGHVHRSFDAGKKFSCILFYPFQVKKQKKKNQIMCVCFFLSRYSAGANSAEEEGIFQKFLEEIQTLFTWPIKREANN